MSTFFIVYGGLALFFGIITLLDEISRRRNRRAPR